MREIAISISNLSKIYSLSDKQPYLSLRDSIVSMVKKIFNGKNSLKKTNQFYSLKKVSLTFYKGEVIGIIGRNGAGKSTLLKVLSQVTPPSSGKATIYGRIGSLLEVGTGFHPELSGRENIYVNGVVLGMTRREVDEVFDEIVEFSGIEAFIDMPVKRYSSGMYVRLAFAVAAHLKPEILIIDEVLAVGDIEFQKKCLGVIEKASQQSNRTVVIVSHNMALIESLCTRVVVLQKGRVSFDGNTKAGLKKYFFDNTSAVSQGLLSKNSQRVGSGELKVHRINISDLKDNEYKYVPTASDININLYYKSYSLVSIKGLYVSVTIRNSLGIPMFILNNRLTGQKLTNQLNSGKFSCKIKKLPLMPGKYSLTYSVMSHNATGGTYIDNIENATYFDVIEGDFFGTGEIPHAEHASFLLEGSWTS